MHPNSEEKRVVVFTDCCHCPWLAIRCFNSVIVILGVTHTEMRSCFHLLSSEDNNSDGHLTSFDILNDKLCVVPLLILWILCRMFS